MPAPAAAPVQVPRPGDVVPVALGALATRADAGPRPLPIGADARVTGVTMASDRVRPGDLFVGAPGRTVHGASFAPGAVAAGAVGVLTDAAGLAFVPDGVPVLVTEDVRAVVGPVAAQVYGDPATHLRMLGITGTSGKTTTAYFVRAGLLAAGHVTGLIGTVATLIGDAAVKTGFTTPEAPELHALLAVMLERGADSVVMEVSSHALDMGRVGGIGYAVSGFTNLSEDHLDFHPDMAGYFQAKARLFDGRSRAAAIVVDDGWGRRMATIATDSGAATRTIATDGCTDADWAAHDVVERADGSTTFRVRGPGLDLATSCVVPGRYNVANAVLALALLDGVGIAPDVAAPAVASATVPGRMERIDRGQDFLAVVDYSHKPAAVEGALRALRPLTRGRLVVVLGCGGDRDRGKRPRMGEIAARGADLLIVTDDNPRSEDPAAIRRAMLDGALGVPAAARGEVREIGDRAEAIAEALGAAWPGDTVLVAGKGHEPGQEIAGVMHPFDDREVVDRFLASTGRR